MAPRLSLWITLLTVPALVSAYSNGSSITFPVPTPVSTTYTSTTWTSQLPTTYQANTDYSAERLAALWQRVGSVSSANVTTTVSPTPEPSVFANPSLGLHPYVPNYASNLTGQKLPDDFLWGLASAAYQVEGAVDADGKGPSVWDLIAHRTDMVTDNTTADVADNHYYLYKQDIARMKALGIKAYSFTLAWSRIFPFGKGPLNEAGVKHYDDVIAELVKAGIKPVVTLTHWDAPLALYDEYGGFLDRQIVDDFFNYAAYVIQRWDAYVDTWITFNEVQWCSSDFPNFPFGTLWPKYHNVSTGDLEAGYLCGHYTLVAHGKVSKWYHNEFNGTGKITFKNYGAYYAPTSSSNASAIAVQRLYDFELGWFGGPWTEDGDYPASMKATLGSLLPSFTAEEKESIKGSCDFFAIDAYTGYYGYPVPDYANCTSNPSHPNFPLCAYYAGHDPQMFPVGPAPDEGSVSWLWSTPGAVRRYLNIITKDLFPSVEEVAVTEFGFSEPFENELTDLNTILWDLRRSDYFQSYLDEILAAIAFDGINVIGAIAWAICDNAEWESGLSTRFGLQYNNYTTQERTPKMSMYTLLRWIDEHSI